MKKAYGYYRVSTDEQAQEGKSIETQRRVCHKWADENGFSIVYDFIDEGKSATNINRPALKELLSKISDEDIEAVIVQDTDRLARNTLDHLTIKSILKKYGANVISVSQPMLDDSPEGHLIDTIIASVNAFQSQITGRKTSKVLAEKAKIGWYPGTAPLGYINVENPNPLTNLDKKIITPDKGIAIYIKEIFERYASGDYSVDDLTKYLIGKGVKPYRGQILNKNTTNHILKNDFYIGMFKWGDIHYKGLHTPLVSEDIFQQVQLVMASHNKNASRKRKHSFLLRGFLFTLKDSIRLIGEIHKKENGKTYSFYCSPINRKGSYASSELLEKQVEDLFKDIQISEQYCEYVMEMAKNIVKESQKEQEMERSNVKNKLIKIEKAMRELENDRFVEGKIDTDTFVRIYSRYEEEQKDIVKQINNINKDYSHNIKSLENILDLAKDIGNAYAKAPYELKRQYLSMFIKKLIVDKDKIVDFELSDEIKALIEEGSVLLSKKWGRLWGTNRTDIENYINFFININK